MGSSAEAQTFEFGEFHLDAATRQLRGPDGVVEVPSRAFEVLLYMVAHPGELLDKARLLKAVWPTTVVEESNLSQCIFALRRAFGDTAAEPRYIATIPGRGYQFIAPVRESSLGIAPTAVTRRRSPRLLQASAALALVVALLVAFRFWPAATPSTPSNVPAPLSSASIAVMPFADLSSSGDMEYFADGLTEELRSSLSKVGGLRIIGRLSSSAFKGTSDDAKSIGEKLHVATILEGSVRKEGDRIDIKVHLIRTRDGVMLWGEMYDRHFDDVLDIQGAIAREVAATLAPAVLDSQKSGQPGSFDAMLTHDAEAYRAYLRGVYLATRWYDYDPQPARVEFLRALERDPQFAKAYAMLARTYQKSAEIGIGDVTQQKSLASEALDKALKLDPSIADLWWVKVTFRSKRNASFVVQATELERAVAASPTDVEPMIWLAHIYMLLGRRGEALQMFERAYAADPLSPYVMWNVAWFGYVLRGDRRRLLDLTDEMERLMPRDARPSWTRSNLAFAEGRALDWDRFVARVIEVDPTDYQNHAWLAIDYGASGAFDAALYHARACLKLAPNSATCVFSLARTEMISGDMSAARKTVLEAVTRDPQNPQILLAQGELQYFTGDCAGALRSIAQGRPDYDQTEAALDLFHYNDDVAMFTWCLRQQGLTERVAEMSRVFNLQYAPPLTAGLFESTRARMAAAMGNRDALITQLTALANLPSPDLAFTRQEPMIQPWLKDREVVALLARIEARRAEWRRVVPKSSMRVPVPESRRASRRAQHH
jgi:TolB-like protein/DNA-binding winged helix-turn-helix (wHTH) protein/Tfp pilus assembly protein PilF